MILAKNKINNVTAQQPKTQAQFLDKEFDLFIRGKKFLSNVTEKTLKWYQSSRSAYKGCLAGEGLQGEISKTQLGLPPFFGPAIMR
jgi:hypothetical protein